MKENLVINYTELDFKPNDQATDALKYNEGYTIAQILKKSQLNHIVISTANKYTSNSNYHPSPITKELINKALNEYKNINILFHSIDPRNLEYTTNLVKNIPNKIKCYYLAHTNRLIDLNWKVEKEQKYHEFFSLMDGIFAFSPEVARKLPFPKNREITLLPLGINEEEYPLQKHDQSNSKFTVVTSLVHSYQRFHPYGIPILRTLLHQKPEVNVVIEVSEQNIEHIRNIPELQELLTQGKLQLITNQQQNIFTQSQVYLSTTKTAEMDINVLKALMSGIPVITPEREETTDLLHTKNSRTFKDPVATDQCRPQSMHEKTAYTECLEQLLRFEPKQFDSKSIREEIIAKGYTATEMVKQLDTHILNQQ